MNRPTQESAALRSHVRAALRRRALVSALTRLLPLSALALCLWLAPKVFPVLPALSGLVVFPASALRLLASGQAVRGPGTHPGSGRRTGGPALRRPGGAQQPPLCPGPCSAGPGCPGRPHPRVRALSWLRPGTSGLAGCWWPCSPSFFSCTWLDRSGALAPKRSHSPTPSGANPSLGRLGLQRAGRGFESHTRPTRGLPPGLGEPGR